MEKSKTVIKKFPASILNKPSIKVKKFGPELEKLASEMVQTMRGVQGVGLAAPQVGKNLKVAVIEFDPSRLGRAEAGPPKNKETSKLPSIPLKVLVNPKIIWRSKEKIQTVEGCLSVPNDEYQLTRSKEIKVLAQDGKGQRIRIRAKGLLAQICQHEIDHLEGILVKDRGKKITKKGIKY